MTDKIEQIIEILDNNDVTHYFPMANINKIATKIAALYSQEPQQAVCPECRGSGKVWSGFYPNNHTKEINCPTCHGTGKVQPETSDEPLTDLNKLLLSPDLLELGINEHYWDSMPEGGERKIYAAIITNLSYAIPRILTKCHQSEAHYEKKSRNQTIIIRECTKYIDDQKAQIKQLEDALQESKETACEFYTKLSNKRADLYEAKIKELEHKLKVGCVDCEDAIRADERKKVYTEILDIAENYDRVYICMTLRSRLSQAPEGEK